MGTSTIEEVPVIVTPIIEDENRISISVGIKQSIPLQNYRNISPSLMVTQKTSPEILLDSRALLAAVMAMYEKMKPSYGYLVLQEIATATKMSTSSPEKVASDLLSLLAKT